MVDTKARAKQIGGHSRYFVPTDTLFTDQWFLHNTGQSGGTVGIDLNLTTVWDEFKGSGVNVAVIDDGFDLVHADLSPNYDTSKDFDFGQNDSDASPVISDDSHGTATMGIVGADDNGSGSVGVAPDATLFGYRLDFAATSAVFENHLSSAIAQAEIYADVVNLSLGIVDFGSQAANVSGALLSGAANGRGGLGTNYIVAAGNARGFVPAASLDANVDSLTNSRVVTAVGAIDDDGFVTSYSSPGANLLVTALGSESGTITTTDRTGTAGENIGDHTNSFAGTSASAPQVAGVVALMLEANPNLGWRDVKEILALSARHVGTDVGSGISGPEFYDWKFNGAGNWNGGGMHFSNDYGFGLVDALAAVRLAESWEAQSTTANEVSVSVSKTDTGAIPDNDPTGLTVTFVVSNNINIETITINPNISHSFAADLIITLTSPSGTVSRLLDETAPSVSYDSGWVFSSNAFRGEESIGTWTLVVSDVLPDDVGVFSSLNFEAFGSAISVNDNYYVTNELSDYAGLFGHSTAFDDLDGGVDSLNATAVSADTIIDFNTNTGSIDGVAVSFSNIENAYGGDGNDTFTGSALVNVLKGGRGGDTLKGGAAADTLDGEAGDDNLEGETGSDVLNGGDGNDTLDGGFNQDTLNGGDGDDDLDGGHGDDIIDGGAGMDAGRYDGFGGAVTINLNLTTAQNTGAAGIETISNVENLIGGIGNDRFTGKVQVSVLEGGGGSDSLFGLGGDDILRGGEGNDNAQGGNGVDTLIGGNGRDTLVGGAGNDTLNGDAGKDVIRGGDNEDIIDGGADRDVLIGGDFTGGGFPGDGAADTFVFSEVSDSAFGGATRDIIRDFEQGLDVIDLSAIDAITGGSDDAFTFIGTSNFSGTAGELRAFSIGGNTDVRVDVDGDGAADMELFLNGTIAMTTGDFVL